MAGLYLVWAGLVSWLGSYWLGGPVGGFYLLWERWLGSYWLGGLWVGSSWLGWVWAGWVLLHGSYWPACCTSDVGWAGLWAGCIWKFAVLLSGRYVGLAANLNVVKLFSC